jgi:dCMP deaminase
MDRAKKFADNFSSDPYMKVACIALDWRGEFMASGFNRTKTVDEAFWYDRDARRKFMIHAEVDLAINLRGRLARAVVITLFPCVHCMTILGRLDIRELYFEKKYDKDKDAFEVAKFYGIEVYQVPDKDGVLYNFE